MNHPISTLRRLTAVVAVVSATACAGANTAELTEGTSGLSSAIPGGDGRALAGYKAEFTANAMQGMDSLMLRLTEVWQNDDEAVLAELFSENVTFVTPDGHLLSSGAAARAFVAGELPHTTGLETWRDDFAASGQMTYVYGRYKVEGPGGNHEGVQITVAELDRFTWRIRSKVYLPFEGAPPRLDPGIGASDPPHVSPDQIRARFGRRAERGQDPRAESAVASYFFMNSFLAQWRHAWANDDFEALTALMGPDIALRIPYDIPAVGRVNAAYSVERLLPAVGDMQMDILDFEASERISFALGRYTLDGMGQQIGGYFIAVVQLLDDGPELRSLVFSGAGANEVATERTGPRPR